MSVLVTVVPLTAELIMLKTPFYGNYEDTDELYREVMKKSQAKNSVPPNKE